MISDCGIVSDLSNLAVVKSNLRATPRDKWIVIGDCRGFLTVAGCVTDSPVEQVVETSTGVLET